MNLEPATPEALFDLGQQAAQRGEHAAAADLLRQALDAYRALRPADHPDIVRIRQNLGVVATQRGDHAGARGYFDQVLEDIRRMRGAEHPDVAAVLNNLGALAAAEGDYRAARRHHEDSLAIKRRAFGDDHPDVATSLNNLGNVFRELGDLVRARTLYEETLEIRRRALGEDHPHVGATLNNLGVVAFLAHDLPTAQDFYTRALEIKRRSLGDTHRDVASSLQNLALVACNLGQYETGRAQYAETLDILRALFPGDHPDIARCHVNLGLTETEIGDHAAARAAFGAAGAMLERLFGARHPDAAVALGLLAASLARDPATHAVAHPTFRRANATRDWQIDLVLSMGSERQRLIFLRGLQEETERFVHFALDHPAPDVVADALDLVLRRKGVVLDAMAADRAAVSAHSDGPAGALAAALRTAKGTLARAWFAPGQDGAALAAMEETVETLEHQLAAALPDRRTPRLAEVDHAGVAAILPRGLALIEFLQVTRPARPGAPPGAKDTPPPRDLVAFVLHADAGCSLIDLGPIDAIEDAIGRINTADAMEPAEARLWARLIAPLLPALRGVTRLLIAPDGELARLPFEMLLASDGRWACEHFTISYVTTGRDALRWLNPATASGPPLIIADPDFALGMSPLPSHAAGPVEQTGRRSADLTRLDQSFDRLAHAGREGMIVQRLLDPKADLISGGAALEARIKARGEGRTGAKARVWHIATHGFFLPDQPAADADDGLENPLLRSGLALAGAQTWRRGGALPPDAEDGLLTALDITSFDLEGTELVVLSCCGSGLGPTRQGQGVFGLQRAFLLAGAAAIVMSLWSVDDAATADLMAAFYAHLRDGRDKADALRRAQAELRRDMPDPIHWAAFILLGDPAPLRAPS
jgi:CHAT domain-containing protein/tetratricopeptide (TPR) repeat protein